MPEVQNPNLQTQGSGGGSGGGDFRSTMAFMLLVFAAILGYQYFFAKPKPQERPSEPAQSQSAASPAPAAPDQTHPAAASARPAVATPTITASQESEFTVENEVFRIVLTNRGARIKHWFLKKYFDSTGKPLDLVQPEAAARFGLPLSLFTYEPALTTQLNDALYQSTVTGAQPSSTGLVVAPATLTYHYAANGVDVVKTIQFNSSYAVNIETEVKRNGEPVRALVEWPAGLGDMEELHQGSIDGGSVPTPSYFAWSIDGKESSQPPPR